MLIYFWKVLREKDDFSFIDRMGWSLLPLRGLLVGLVEPCECGREGSRSTKSIEGSFSTFGSIALKRCLGLTLYDCLYGLVLDLPVGTGSVDESHSFMLCFVETSTSSLG